MTSERRAGLHRDAGGDDPEEAAVCYLQILLADHVGGLGRERLMQDMDSWGYSFRLGSTRQWFEEDAEDSRNWLIKYGIIAQYDDVTFHLRAQAVCIIQHGLDPVPAVLFSDNFNHGVAGATGNRLPGQPASAGVYGGH